MIIITSQSYISIKTQIPTNYINICIICSHKRDVITQSNELFVCSECVHACVGSDKTYSAKYINDQQHRFFNTLQSVCSHHDQNIIDTFINNSHKLIHRYSGLLFNKVLLFIMHNKGGMLCNDIISHIIQFIY